MPGFPDNRVRADGPMAALDALAAQVPDGALVSLHKGDEPDVPMALALALVRRGVRGLRVVTLPTAAYPASGLMLDVLIGAGCVAELETAGVSLHELGAAPCFTRAVRAGTLRLRDSTCPALYAALQAGAKGQPLAVLHGLIGSDLQRQRSDWRLIDHPFQPGQRLVAMPPLNPDVALFHAPLADAHGNVWVGRDRDRVLAAHAAERTLVTVERLHPGNLLDDEALAAGTIPAELVQAWALVPGGCWPMAVDGATDLAAVRAYQQAARSEAGFAQWLARQLPTVTGGAGGLGACTEGAAGPAASAVAMATAETTALTTALTTAVKEAAGV